MSDVPHSVPPPNVHSERQSDFPKWVKPALIVAALGFAFWMFSGNFWSPYSTSNFTEECEESGFTNCACIVDYMKAHGYTPNQLSGDDYPAGALGAGLAC